MDHLTSDALDAMLVEATTFGAPARLPTIVSQDELQAMAAHSASSANSENTAPATERCTNTCGGCRG